MKRTLTVLAALAIGILTIAAPATLSSAASSPNLSPQHRTSEILGVQVDFDLPFTATVVEAFDSDSHTFALVEDEDGRRWLAAPRTEVKAGMVVRHGDGTLMRNVHSAALNRTFTGVFFIAAMQAE